MYKYADMIYEGKKLIDYCCDMNYDYDSVYIRLKYIFKTKRFNKLSKKKKIELAINRYNNRDNYKYASYIYKGKRLKDYCKDNNIDIQYMYSRLGTYEKSNRKKHLPLDIKIQMAINCYNGINDFIYANMKYKGQRLSDYCKEHNIKYSLIRNRIYHDRIKGYIKDFPDESRIDLYIERYKKQEKLMNLKKNINLLKGEKLSNLKYKMIACELNINYDKALKLYRKSKLSDIGKAMILIWYSSDIVDDDGLYVSNDKLKELKDINNLDINDLIGLFKSGYKEVLLNILSFEKYYVMGMIKKQLHKYDIVIPRYQYKELYDYITFELIKGIDSSVMRYPGQIVNYIEIIVMHKTLDYVMKNIYNKSYCYNDCLDSMKNYNYIEY